MTGPYDSSVSWSQRLHKLRETCIEHSPLLSSLLTPHFDHLCVACRGLLERWHCQKHNRALKRAVSPYKPSIPKTGVHSATNWMGSWLLRAPGASFGATWVPALLKWPQYELWHCLNNTVLRYHLSTLQLPALPGTPSDPNWHQTLKLALQACIAPTERRHLSPCPRHPFHLN